MAAECGSRLSISCTWSANPSMPRRMSVGPVASHTLTPLGTGIIAARAPAAPRDTAGSMLPEIRSRPRRGRSISITPARAAVPPPRWAPCAGARPRTRSPRRPKPLALANREHRGTASARCTAGWRRRRVAGPPRAPSHPAGRSRRPAPASPRPTSVGVLAHGRSQSPHPLAPATGLTTVARPVLATSITTPIARARRPSPDGLLRWVAEPRVSGGPGVRTLGGRTVKKKKKTGSPNRIYPTSCAVASEAAGRAPDAHADRAGLRGAHRRHA